MKKGLPLLLLALLLHAHAPAALAQTISEAEPAAAASEATRVRAELERKALVLVEEALADAQALKLAENRVRAQVAGAKMLWPRNPKAARATLKAAADAVVEMNAAVDPEDPQFYSAAQNVANLRAELIKVAAPYDANLALEFLRATRPAHAEALAAAGYGQPGQEQSIEMAVVAYLVAQEPQRAFEMAEESLGKSVTLSLLNVMQHLRSREPALGTRLAGDIVRRLRPEDLRAQHESASVAQQLLALTRPSEPAPTNAVANAMGPLVVVSVGEVSPGANGAPLLDEQTRRELIEKVLTAVAAGGGGQSPGAFNLFQAYQVLLPELEKTAPARVAALRRQVEELERSFNPRARQMRGYQELMTTGTVEAVLEAARKAPADARDQLYTHAAMKVFNEGGDAERARQILENVSNPQLRAQARREMEQRAHWRSVQEGSFKEARQSVARLKTPEERVQALMQIAGRAASSGETETARQLLDEARTLVESQTRGHSQFGLRLQIANAYARFDAAASFEVVESAVVRLDGLLDAAEVLDGFGQDAFTEGELKWQGGYIWNDMIYQCAQTLALLAREDFERAAAAAKKFRHIEARTTAQLTLAQSLLDAVNSGEAEVNSRVLPRNHKMLRIN
jgi:hypothetical protein